MGENKYGLKITPIASQDLDEIYSYIANELFNEDAAEKLIEKKDFPLSCSFVADEFLKQKGYRKLVIDNYIAFYIVNEEEKQVVIMRVLYGRQKYQDII